MVEIEEIINRFAYTDEDKSKLAFHMAWTPLNGITEADISAYPFYATVKRAKQQYFSEKLAEKMLNAEQSFKSKHLTQDQCIQVKTECLVTAKMLGVRL